MVVIEDCRMAVERDLGSPFTGMIFLLRRVLPETFGGRPQSFPLIGVALAPRPPRRP